MLGFLTSGPDYFPGWLSIVFSVGLALGIVHHLPCLIHGHGNRWFHAGHVTMALSMMYMFLSMSYYWIWLPAAWQMWLFIASSTAVGVYLLAKFVSGQPVNLLWLLLLVGQASMAYMWFPMMRWNAILIFVLVSWFAIETFGWAANLFPDDVRSTANHRWFPYELALRRRAAPKTPARQVATECKSMSLSTGGQAFPDVARGSHAGDQLVASDWKERTLMATMALSMGYMFFGMQLLAAAVPTMQ